MRCGKIVTYRISLIIAAIFTTVPITFAGLSIDTTPIIPQQELHPNLYFTHQDISILRTKKDIPPYSDWWVQINSASNAYLEQDLSSSSLTEEERSKGAKVCAFAFVITDDDHCAEKAREALLAMWTSPGSNSRRMLEAAYHLQSYCEAYDWVQTSLDPSDDVLIREKLASEAERFYNDPVLWSPFGYTNNWGVKAAAALGTAALVISDYSAADHSPTQWLGRALERINSLLSVLTTDDGLWIEGSHYLTYTCGNVIPFLWHYKNISHVDLFADLRPLFDFALLIRYPDGHTPNLEDAYSNIFPHSMVAPAYERNTASLHMWAYEEGPGFDTVWWTQDVKEIDLIIIHDTSIQVSPPAEQPSVFLDDARVAVLRSGWADEDIYLYLNGAPDYNNMLAGGVHTHPDPLEFIFYAQKAILANDAGYGPDGFSDTNRLWYTNPEAHNIILIDGIAPQNAPIAVSTWIASEEMVFAEMIASYGEATLARGTLLVGNEYAIVADYVTADEVKECDFILHGRGAMTHVDRHVVWSLVNTDSMNVEFRTYLFPSTTTLERRSGLACFEWGQEETNEYIISHAEGESARFLTLLLPGYASDLPHQVFEVSGEDYVGVYCNDDFIVLQGDTLLLSLDEVQSDARLVFLRTWDAGLWLIEDGRTLTWNDVLFMQSSRRISITSSPPGEYRYTLHISQNDFQYSLYLALPDSMWALAASLNETHIPTVQEADGVSLEITGGGRLTVELTLAREGDIIPDGVVDVLDLVRAVNIMLDIEPEATRHEIWAADTNSDGKIDLLDLVDIVNIILSVR
ncbi:MAG: DUF4962 domain-containing protein [Gemmatimonadota bacterium]|nr:MAG: DUF4962 domain-containing protein [Gemmatimonadota bacterium]